MNHSRFWDRFNAEHEAMRVMSRRQFFGRSATGIGIAALAGLLGPASSARAGAGEALAGLPHFPPRAKRVIYLLMNGAPSQLDLFDHKPGLADHFNADLPPSVRMGQRITGMTSGQARLPIAPSIFTFARHGKSGAWISELLPHTARVVDDLAIIKTVNTEAINHDPAVTFLQTGSQQPGRPCLGSWLSYGLGSDNSNLPAFVVLLSIGSGGGVQPLFDRLWSSGFLPASHQGVKLRGVGDPVLYLKNPPGVDAGSRRRMIDGVNDLNRIAADAFGDPEIHARIQQYEMAYRMQTSVPELTDLTGEPDSTFELYGEAARVRGSFAANCLLARRLVERGVRFVQLYHNGWDQHNNLPENLRKQCGDVDRASAALVTDLKRRGMLDDTLVIWGGEFGRTVYSQGDLTATNYGRDHHGRCFSVWMAGGGVRRGIVHGETDDFGYNIVRDPVHIHDLHATILHCLGIDHERLTFRYQGRDFRLTDVHGHAVGALLA